MRIISGCANHNYYVLKNSKPQMLGFWNTQIKISCSCFIDIVPNINSKFVRMYIYIHIYIVGLNITENDHKKI